MRHHRLLRSLTVISLLLASVTAGWSQYREPSPEEFAAAARAFDESLDYRAGNIELSEADAVLNLSEEFRYLGPEDTRRLLEEAWGNPPGFQGQGAIVPVGFSAFDGSWAVIISFKEDGYVSDEDAASIDYDELLAEMQRGTEEESQERTKQGYEAMRLVGWAEPPHYDALSHKLYWAQVLRFGLEPEQDTLNYNIRALGRRGVLVLNAVGTMGQLEDIRSGMQGVLPLVEFDHGSRYVDFDPSADKVAAYGIGALVAGKLAAKAGLLAKFAPILLGFKKFGIFLVLGLVGIFKKVFGGRGKQQAVPPRGTA